MTLEREIEKQVRDYCKLRGYLCYKFVSPGRRGVPDRLIIYPNGKVLFLELKQPGCRPTMLQLREMNILREHDVDADWADSFDDATGIIDALYP